MKLNGKYFVAPEKNSDNFKVLFSRLAAEGVGRPVDREGHPDGPWTPELLTDAICAIEANKSGIELRTVQLWFQDNLHGISASNLRWLARIFGCGDPDMASQWQSVLTAANRRLAEERKSRRRTAPPSVGIPGQGMESELSSLSATSATTDPDEPIKRFSLARNTEAFFTSRSSMALPVTVFIGATSLGLIAYTLNIHSVIHRAWNGPDKQVGFLWAPNWTIVFLIVLPLYLAILTGVIKRWRNRWRNDLSPSSEHKSLISSWKERIDGLSYAFWATLIVTVLIASVYNWIAVHMIPLLNGDAEGWPVDWAKIAVFQPDTISIKSTILFTALVFIYNGFCSYLFFSGFVLLFAITQDYIDVATDVRAAPSDAATTSPTKTCYTLMHGIFRCTALGMIITILMKLQSSYLQSTSPDILAWLLTDARSLLSLTDPLASTTQPLRSAPGHFYSFFCVVAIIGTFANASIRMRTTLPAPSENSREPVASISYMAMDIIMVLLLLSYLMIGAIAGFTIVLFVTAVLTTFLVSKTISFHDPPTEDSFDEKHA